MRAPPQVIVDQILAIAPILPGQGQYNPSAPPGPIRKQSHPQAPLRNDLVQMEPHNNVPPTQQLPSIAGNPLHPTSDPRQLQSNYVGEEPRLNDGMARMSIQQPLQPTNPSMTGIPEYRAPLKRADTDTNEVDVFVDART